MNNEDILKVLAYSIAPQFVCCVFDNLIRFKFFLRRYFQNRSDVILFGATKDEIGLVNQW